MNFPHRPFHQRSKWKEGAAERPITNTKEYHRGAIEFYGPAIQIDRPNEFNAIRVSVYLPPRRPTINQCGPIFKYNWTHPLKLC